jgi:NitT/TauT family transport system ATP-binding protein
MTMVAKQMSEHDVTQSSNSPATIVLGSPQPRPEAISVVDVNKEFGQGTDAIVALDHISLSVGRGEFVSVLGASGCGKTTLLNMLAGLDRPTAGTVSVTGQVGLMFQESALFPWLSIGRNVETALRLRGVPRGERKAMADELLASVHLSGFERKRPHELSGGMRQRAALARALAQQADVLLMDEPFGALDAITREVLHAELERHWKERQLTILFVTHDVREAVRLGDRVVLLSSRPGRVVADVPIELTRPRRLENSDVVELASIITERLHSEVRRHAND